MRLLLLAEGDAERWDSWSGSTKSVVDHLRRAGHDVVTADVDLYGQARWLAAARNFSPNRKRWEVRYPLADPAYRRDPGGPRGTAAHGHRSGRLLQRQSECKNHAKCAAALLGCAASQVLQIPEIDPDIEHSRRVKS